MLEAVDAGAAILDYVNANRVDHVVLGARTDARFRNILGSVSIEIVQKAPCTVTVVRKQRNVTVEAGEGEAAIGELGQRKGAHSPRVRPFRSGLRPIRLPVIIQPAAVPALLAVVGFPARYGGRR